MSRHTEKYRTTRQLSRLWMVSEATVKRWADAGMLKSSRTAGGHRRFLVEEVTRFQNERGLGASPAASAPAREGDEEGRREVPVERFYEAITKGQEDNAARLILEAYLDGGDLWRLFDATVADAMRRIGEHWHDGSVTVADEHYATRTATRAVERVGVSVRRRAGNGRLAICCAPEGELHEFAVLCLQVLLESEGWRVRSLGGNTPLFTLADAIERHRPELVCVSSTLLADLERCAREYVQVREAAAARGARVALGGEGFRGEAIRRRFQADSYCESFMKLRGLIRE